MRVDEIQEVIWSADGGLRLDIKVDERVVTCDVADRATLQKELGENFADDQLRVPVDITKILSIENHWQNRKGRIRRIIAFRNRAYHVTGDPIGDNADEEVFLSVRRHVLAQERKLQKLRAEVKALERLESDLVKNRREAIPDYVRMLVYERDGGKCVKCQSSKDLHFDHIIPFSKGGGNSDKNIQLLCERCNLEKGDRLI